MGCVLDSTLERTDEEGFLTRPRWLDEERLPNRVLDRFLTKLESGQRLSMRVNSKTTPELFDFQDEDVRYQWELLKSLDKEFHILNIKLERNKAHQESYENARLYFNPDKEPLVRHWLNRPAIDPYALVWEAELAKQKHHFDDYGQALFERIVRLPDRGPEQTIKAFARIGKELQKPITLRALSARCFWGDSKFLEHNEQLVRDLFPSVEHNILPRPILMCVHLPEQLEHVLFVENQDTFLALAAANLPNYALVYSAGFRGSALRIRTPGNAVFSFMNHSNNAIKEAFEAWWFEANNKHASNKDSSNKDASNKVSTINPIKTWLWGDLDFAGFTILKALRQTFSTIKAWQPGYLPMLNKLETGWGHGHEESGKGLQKDPEQTGCEFTDTVLLPAMREEGGFVDQEVVSLEELMAVLEHGGSE